MVAYELHVNSITTQRFVFWLFEICPEKFLWTSRIMFQKTFENSIIKFYIYADLFEMFKIHRQYVHNMSNTWHYRYMDATEFYFSKKKNRIE